MGDGRRTVTFFQDEFIDAVAIAAEVDVLLVKVGEVIEDPPGETVVRVSILNVATLEAAKIVAKSVSIEKVNLLLSKRGLPGVVQCSPKVTAPLLFPRPHEASGHVKSALLPTHESPRTQSHESPGPYSLPPSRVFPLAAAS